MSAGIKKENLAKKKKISGNFSFSIIPVPVFDIVLPMKKTTDHEREKT